MDFAIGQKGEMMNDTIYRQAAIDTLEEYIEEYDGLDECGLHSEKWCAMSEAKMAIEALPSAQPEIIHCKDCKHHIDGRCLVANHHTVDHECCAEVFGAERKE